MTHTLQIGPHTNEAELITTEIWETAPSASIMLEMLSESEAFRNMNLMGKYEPHFHLFSAWCARRVRHLLADERSHRAIRTAEQFATGRSTRRDLQFAYSEAEAVVVELAKSYDEHTLQLTDELKAPNTNHPTGVSTRRLFVASLLHAASTASMACHADRKLCGLHAAKACAKYSSNALYWEMLTGGADRVLITEFLEQEERRQAQALRVFLGNPFDPERAPAMALTVQ